MATTPSSTPEGGSQTGKLIGVCSAGIAICTTVLVLRCISRRRVGLWLDDFFIILAYPIVVACNTIQMALIPHGFGKHSNDMAVIDEFNHFAYFTEVTYNLGIGAIKMSVLFMYLRIFPLGYVRKSVYILMALVITWEIGTEFAIIFQCIPIRKLWHPQLSGHCIDQYKFFIGQATPNIVTDALLLVLPLWPVSKLQMPRPQKIIVSSIFLLGIFVIACSITRLIYFVHITFLDPTWNWVVPALWTIAELNVGFICACLPTCNAVFRSAMAKIMPSFSGGSYDYHSSDRDVFDRSRATRKSQIRNVSSEEDDMAAYLTKGSGEREPMPNLDIEQMPQSVGRVEQRTSSWGEGDGSIAMDGIHVKREILVTSANDGAPDVR